MLIKRPEITFEFCDYGDALHRQALIDLINHYKTDPMGGCDPLTSEEADALVKGLSAHPSSFVLFVKSGDIIAGLAVCFVNFSTFKAKPFINIHDLVVYKKYRNKGLGRAILEKIIALARERGCCKVTLEVRIDNAKAQGLYRNIGFQDTNPPMYFWNKNIDSIPE
jgi:ribosomal protein S18 acetylase RimI-like enzyme